MTGKRVRVLALVAAGAFLWTSPGCVIGFDALSPAFFAGLGLDPGTIFPASGTIIVSFTNNTDGVAVFYAFESSDADDLRLGSRNFSVEVDAGESGNEVLTCPVEVVSPGSLGADFSIQDVAVVVVGPDGTQDVSYVGSPLLEASDYTCGAVIDIQLSSNYTFTVRVLPGG